ncbi:MAG TPA: hypothetical protein VF618_08085 [Thermoanaerobaculia bacterium]
MRYTVRSGGCPGDIAGDAANGLLVSRRVADELERIAGDAIALVPAVLDGVPEECERREYLLLRVRHVVSLSAIDAIAIPVFAVRFEVDSIGITAEARERLEAVGVAAEHFAEMLFAG